MSPSYWLILTLLVPLFGGLACLPLTRLPRAADWLYAIVATLTFACTLALTFATHQGAIVTVHPGSWPGATGIVLAVDAFAALMLTFSNFITFCAAFYIRKGLPMRYKARRFHAFTCFLILGVNGAFMTADLFNLYVWFEVMILSSFALLGIVPGKKARTAALRYVVMNLIASLLFLAGVGFIYAKTGTLNIADLALMLHDPNNHNDLSIWAILLFAAFAIKAAVFPFSIWLPGTYPRPPIAVTAIFSAMLTKVGVYALYRCFGMVFIMTTESMLLVIGILAALSMATGVLGAACQGRMRDILAYHSVSQIGYMIAGLALLSPIAFAASIIYVLQHMIVKSNLFFICGHLELDKRGDKLADIGGMAGRKPWLAVLFLIPALSLAGIPILFGFWTKYAIIRATFEDHTVWLGVVGLAVGFFTLFSMAKIWAGAFWKKTPETIKHQPKVRTPVSMIIPLVLMAAAVVSIGLYPGPLLSMAYIAAEQLLDPSAYIEAVLGQPPLNTP